MSHGYSPFSVNRVGIEKAAECIGLVSAWVFQVLGSNSISSLTFDRMLITLFGSTRTPINSLARTRLLISQAPEMKARMGSKTEILAQSPFLDLFPAIANYTVSATWCTHRYNSRTRSKSVIISSSGRILGIGILQQHRRSELRRQMAQR